MLILPIRCLLEFVGSPDRSPFSLPDSDNEPKVLRVPQQRPSIAAEEYQHVSHNGEAPA